MNRCLLSVEHWAQTQVRFEAAKYRLQIGQHGVGMPQVWRPSTLTETDPLLLMEIDPASAHEVLVYWLDPAIPGLPSGNYSFVRLQDHSSAPTWVPHDMTSGGGQ